MNEILRGIAIPSLQAYNHVNEIVKLVTSFLYVSKYRLDVQ